MLMLGDEAGPVREICHGEVGIESDVDRLEVKPWSMMLMQVGSGELRL